MIDLIFNELSVPLSDASNDPREAMEAAQKLMSCFVGVMMSAQESAVGGRFLANESFAVTPLCADYTVANWRHDREVDHELRSYFLRKATQYRYFTDLSHSSKIAAAIRSVSCDGEVGDGLLACHLINGIAISFATRGPWLEAFLPVSLNQLQDDGALQTTDALLRNAASVEHWQKHEYEFIEKTTAEIKNGSSLLFAAPLVLPNLEFCGDAPKQLESMTGNEKHFKWVVGSLLRADLECKRWSGTAFPHQRLPGPATPESERVHTNKVLRAARVFSTLAGDRLMFEFHMKCIGENQRIHYLPDLKRRKLMIGYIGEHLPL